MAEAEAMAAAGAEMNGYGADMYAAEDGGAYYYGSSGAPSESGEGDDTVVMRQNEYY